MRVYLRLDERWFDRRLMLRYCLEDLRKDVEERLLADVTRCSTERFR